MPSRRACCDGGMRAVTISDGQLHWTEHPDPEPGLGEVLIAVRAAGVNAGDLLQVRGYYPAPPGSPADIPGLELAGEIVAVGPGVRDAAVGDRVMAVVGGGGQAELAVVHERCLLPVPDDLDWPRAGGFPEAFTTAHDAMFAQAELTVGERVLIHGAAGGVGTAAVQLAAAAGAQVTATVRNPDLREDVGAFGATVIEPDGFEAYGPFDVILELIGGPNLWPDIRALATGGRIAVIGAGAGPKAEISLVDLMAARGRIHGSTLRARPLEDKADAAQRIIHSVLPLLRRGNVDVPVAETFAMSDAAAAYDRFRAGGKLGKVVLVNE